MLSGLDQGCCNQAEARFASHHCPGFWLVGADPSCPLIGWLGLLTPLAAWIWSLDLICVVQTDKSLSLHTVSTLLSRTQSVTSPCSFTYWCTGGDKALSLAFCQNSHNQATQMSKVYWENKGSSKSLSIIYSILKLILLASRDRSRFCHCYSVVGDSFARMTPTSCPH